LVKIAHNWFSVVLSTRSKHVNCIMLAHCGQKIEAIWADIKLELIALMSKANISFITVED
jgi:hypothetical protein